MKVIPVQKGAWWVNLISKIIYLKRLNKLLTLARPNFRFLIYSENIFVLAVEIVFKNKITYNTKGCFPRCFPCVSPQGCTFSLSSLLSSLKDPHVRHDCYHTCFSKGNLPTPGLLCLFKIEMSHANRIFCDNHLIRSLPLPFSIHYSRYQLNQQEFLTNNYQVFQLVFPRESFWL